MIIGVDPRPTSTVKHVHVHNEGRGREGNDAPIGAALESSHTLACSFFFKLQSFSFLVVPLRTTSPTSVVLLVIINLSCPQDGVVIYIVFRTRMSFEQAHVFLTTGERSSSRPRATWENRVS